MNLDGLANAIRARVQADTGSGGAWETSGLYKLTSVLHEDGQRATQTGAIDALYPYMVYSLISADTGEDGFTSDSVSTDWRLHVFDDKKNTATGAEGALRSLGILNRLFGDALAQSNRVPTFGFHRHQLSLTVTGDASAPWAAGVCEIERLNSNHDEDAYHWIYTMRVRQSRSHV